MHRTALLLAAACACACGKSDRAPSPSSSPAPAAPPPLAHATQADLARDVADAERLGTWSDVSRRWQGQAVRWTVTHRPALCRSADDCFVAAFPIQRPARQGWMPELQFAPGQYDALTGRCTGRDPCDVTVEATLSKLEVSPELPTSVQLSNVQIVAPRPGAQTARR
jgi:hypothetical protein